MSICSFNTHISKIQMETAPQQETLSYIPADSNVA